MNHIRHTLVPLILLLLLAACGGSSSGDEPNSSNSASNAEVDAGMDSAVADTTVDDTTTPDSDPIADTDLLDSAQADTEVTDTEVTDTEVTDTEVTDTGSDAAPEDIGADVCEGDDCPPDCVLECPVGQRRCDGEQGVSVCEEDTPGCSAWVAAEPCEGDLICQGGGCVASCEESDTRCLDQETRQICEGGRLAQEICPGGCDPATRACFICPDGAWRCADDGDRLRLERCQGGTRWVLEDVCQECGCSASPDAIVMQCRFVRDDTPTSCTQCTDDGTTCLP